ncbi:TfoX/Sxy family DNA transformation protein [Thaumasiovibrio subtropicus]|uniref:TfoX/Sxy family DNA transformation protein n=1 Tax=Thaumasiovibrio subtropicus TaxID=1891207 RepID=UPI000B35652B|nr:TfoX/Sxy family DNA transformation protein [Thaumasiovibrio subtropicus]
MDKPVLKTSIKLLSRFGTIKSRSMFGGFGLFLGETMFALVVNDKLHLRANASNERQFKESQFQPYVYKKRGFPVVTKYYAIPDTWWDDEDQIISQASLALTAAQEDKKDQEAKKAKLPDRIKDLPNLRLANERMLKKAGITTVEELVEKGALQAFRQLQDTQGESLNVELLWALEGAITGKHWSVVTEDRRQELLSKLGG